jgi:hypothetical protein
MAIMDWIIPLLWTTIFVSIWSIVYRENMAYRIAESLAIGLLLGFTVYTGLEVIYNRVFKAYSSYSAGNLTAGVLLSVYIAAILGILIWTRLYEPTQWIARWPLAILTGIGTGIAVRGAVEAQITKQLVMNSWYVAGDWLASINAILIAVGTFTTMSYFLFTHKQEGPLYISTLIGRIFMMIAFGTMLGLFLMTVMAYPVGMVFQMMKFPAIIAVIIACAAIVYDIYGPGWPGPFAKTE